MSHKLLPSLGVYSCMLQEKTNIPDHLSVIQDHAGHIFGVDSTPMIEKLEQYNAILEVCLLNTFTQILHFALVNSLSLFSCNTAWHTSSCDNSIAFFLSLLTSTDWSLILFQKVIEMLESQSGPGGIHENTLLLVMGDHGQTLNGDHGGGSPEEV